MCACLRARDAFNVRALHACVCACVCVCPTQPEYEEECMVPLDVMPLNGVGHTFTVLRREPGSIALGKLINVLKFK